MLKVVIQLYTYIRGSMKELMVMLKRGITAEMVLVMELESGCGNGRIISKVEVVTVGALKEVVMEVVALLHGGSNMKKVL